MNGWVSNLCRLKKTKIMTSTISPFIFSLNFFISKCTKDSENNLNFIHRKAEIMRQGS